MIDIMCTPRMIIITITNITSSVIYITIITILVIAAWFSAVQAFFFACDNLH